MEERWVTAGRLMMTAMGIALFVSGVWLFSTCVWLLSSQGSIKLLSLGAIAEVAMLAYGAATIRTAWRDE